VVDHVRATDIRVDRKSWTGAAAVRLLFPHDVCLRKPRVQKSVSVNKINSRSLYPTLALLLSHAHTYCPHELCIHIYSHTHTHSLSLSLSLPLPLPLPSKASPLQNMHGWLCARGGRGDAARRARDRRTSRIEPP
jgi:hypothetical protein